MATPGDNSVARDRNSLRAAFADGETLNVRVSEGPARLGDGGEPDSAARIYFRAYTAGVTDEAPGRYSTQAGLSSGAARLGACTRRRICTWGARSRSRSCYEAE